MRSIGLCLAWASLLLLTSAASLRAAATPEEKTKATKAQEVLRDAGRLVIARKYADAKPLVEEAQQLMAELKAGSDDAKKLAVAIERRLTVARRLLKSKGVEVADIPTAAPSTTTPGTTPAPPAGAITFSQHVVPIFLARCNNCHVTGNRGGFSMANYAALMQGSNAGKVIFPGKSDGSRIMEVLLSGDMPRGGGRLNNTQIDTIAKWIDAGAQFDGQNQNAALASLVPATPTQPRLQVVQATGNETIKFSRDIAPVLAEHCTGCHGGNRPQARLSLESFTRLLAGNREGLIVTPGKPAESKIVMRLKAPEAERMPQRKPALPAETIAKFEKWVAEGAKFDGRDPEQSTEMVAHVYRASQMSHEELAEERLALAQSNWRLANPDDQPDRVETENFALLGNVGESYLQEIGREAESTQAKVARILKAPAGSPLVKGRITLFVFKRRFDYSELGTMVEKRSIPGNWNGHWKYNVIDAYAALVPPQDDESSLTGLVAEQLAGTYLDSLGESPQWFSQGMAWAVGSTVDPKDARSKLWDQDSPGILAASGKADAFLSGTGVSAEERAVLNYSFCKFLLSNARGFNVLLNELKEETPFDQAFAKAYRGDPKQVATQWAAKLASGRRR